MKDNQKNVIIFNESTIGWTFIDVNHLFKLFKKHHIDYLILSEINHNQKVNNPSIFTQLDSKYKSISLYNVCIYNICNELQVFNNEVSIEKHSEVISKWYNIGIKTIDYLELVFQKNYVNGAIVFHGHLLFEACLLAMCKINKVKFITFENTSNKERLVWDDVSGFVVTYNLAKIFFYKKFKKFNKKIIEDYCANYIDNIHTYKRLEHQTDTINKENLPFQENFILFICQVYNDASLLFSLDKDIKNPIEIIEKTQIIAEQEGYNLIIKLHPKEVKSKDPVTKSFYKKPTLKRLGKIKDKENVFIDINNEYDTFKLINTAKAVVTINSQAGIEASLFNKPVFTYINCFYSDLGFTYDYDNLESLNKNLREVLKVENPINRNLSNAKRFFYIYFEKYCIPRSSKFVFTKLNNVFKIKKIKEKKLLIFIKFINKTGRKVLKKIRE